VIVRILKFTLALPLVVGMTMMIMINIGLSHRQRVRIVETDTIDLETLNELKGLKRALHNNADAQMQNLYPEGYVFMNAIYALAWSSFLQDQAQRSFVEEGVSEIQKACHKIDSPEGRAVFSPDLPLAYGAFYQGWSAYVLGNKLHLQKLINTDSKEIERFQLQCAMIAKALSQNPFPESHPQAAWPADAVICAAALSLHDRIFTPRYSSVLKKWIINLGNITDSNGLIPHEVNATDHTILQSSRGSSMALMLVFLHDIDLQFASEQYKLFKNNFIDTTLSLTGVREYPKGQSGKGDVDSGPLMFGYGGAATIVGTKTLSLYGDDGLSARVKQTVEAFSFPTEDDGEKKYFFGALPMADAFIVWSHSRFSLKSVPSFVEFRIYSVFIFLFASVFFWLVVSKRKTVRTSSR
jgi:hypothetical protein